MSRSLKNINITDLRFNDGLKRLSEINPEFKMKSWYFDKSEYIDSREDFGFWKTLPKKHIDNQKIPLNKVVGTSHVGYTGKTWIEVLGKLKKYKRWDWNKNTFLNKYRDEEIEYMKLDDKYYVLGGNNRTVIAKFLGFEYLEAKVVEYSLDKEFYNVYNDISNLGLRPELKNYWRGSSWKIILNNRHVHLRDFSIVKQFLAFYNGTQVTYWKSLKRKLYGYTSKSENSFFLKEDSDLDSLKSEIINHKIKLSYSSSQNFH